jgi:preprotein translocase SecE subunit
VAGREDRAKRREERRASAGTDAPANGRARSSDGERAARADAAPVPNGEPTKEGGGGVVGFARESIGELKKVEWPGQTQVVQATTVVIIACIIVGSWLYANDFVWQRVFKDFLLK